jgi:hypothetical protein
MNVTDDDDTKSEKVILYALNENNYESALTEKTTGEAFTMSPRNQYKSNREEEKPYIVMSFIVMYSLVTIFSILCNVTILTVILRRRRMRTVMNFFIANIVVANLLYTVCVPFHVVAIIYDKSFLIDFMCPMLPLFETAFINANTFTMVAASMDQLIIISG